MPQRKLDLGREYRNQRLMQRYMELMTPPPPAPKSWPQRAIETVIFAFLGVLLIIAAFIPAAFCFGFAALGFIYGSSFAIGVGAFCGTWVFLMTVDELLWSL